MGVPQPTGVWGGVQSGSGGDVAGKGSVVGLKVVVVPGQWED